VKRRPRVGLGLCEPSIFDPCEVQVVSAIQRDVVYTDPSAICRKINKAYQIHHLLLEGGRIPSVSAQLLQVSKAYRGVSICLLFLSSLLCFLPSLHVFRETVSTIPSKSNIEPERAKTRDTRRMASAFRRWVSGRAVKGDDRIALLIVCTRSSKKAYAVSTDTIVAVMIWRCHVQPR